MTGTSEDLGQAVDAYWRSATQFLFLPLTMWNAVKGVTTLQSTTFSVKQPPAVGARHRLSISKPLTPGIPYREAERGGPGVGDQIRTRRDRTGNRVVLAPHRSRYLSSSSRCHLLGRGCRDRRSQWSGGRTGGCLDGRLVVRATKGTAGHRRMRRASSTTRTAGSGGSPPASPPTPPGARVRSGRDSSRCSPSLRRRGC